MTDDLKQHSSKLMKKVQDGDQKAYAELLNLVGGKILGIIRRRIKNQSTVEELYQTVLMTIHRARHTYDPNRPFEPWLYSITRNTVFDHLRKNRRKIELETLVGEHFAIEAEPDSSAEEQKILKTALNSLPQAQRQAVQLIKLQGLSIQDAAKKVGVTESAMKVRAHRGYQGLKKFLLKEIKEAS